MSFDNRSRLKQVWDGHMNCQSTTVAEPVAELAMEVAEVVATVSKALTERIVALT
jgi:colicin import membrane protein